MIAGFKNIRVITENLDCLHEASGIYPYRIDPNHLRNEIPELTDALAYEMGSLLARIHLNRVAGYGDLSEPHNLSPDPRVYFTLKFEEGFDECSNHLPNALMDQCRRYFNTHLHLLASVDGPCIIHRDKIH